MIVTGVRSSWLASSMNRRCAANAPSRRSSISLNVAASSAISSWPRTSIRRLRSVTEMACAVWRTSRTGARIRSESRKASRDPATSIAARPPPPRARPRRRRGQRSRSIATRNTPRSSPSTRNGTATKSRIRSPPRSTSRVGAGRAQSSTGSSSSPGPPRLRSARQARRRRRPAAARTAQGRCAGGRPRRFGPRRPRTAPPSQGRCRGQPLDLADLLAQLRLDPCVHLLLRICRTDEDRQDRRGREQDDEPDTRRSRTLDRTARTRCARRMGNGGGAGMSLNGPSASLGTGCRSRMRMLSSSVSSWRRRTRPARGRPGRPAPRPPSPGPVEQAELVPRDQDVERLAAAAVVRREAVGADRVAVLAGRVAGVALPAVLRVSGGEAGPSSGRARLGHDRGAGDRVDLASPSTIAVYGRPAARSRDPVPSTSTCRGPRGARSRGASQGGSRGRC